MNKKHETLLPDFSWVHWSASDIEQLRQTALKEKLEVYAELKQIHAEKRTFQNTVYAIEASNHTIVPVINKLELLFNVSPDPKIRVEAQNTLQYLQQKLIEIEYDEQVYKALLSYDETRTRLSSEDSKLLFDMKREYKRLGLGLLREEREELQQMLKRMSELSLQFSQSINDWKDDMTVTQEDLFGLPQEYIQRLRKDTFGNYLVGLDYPEYFPFMQSARNNEKRKELMDKSLRRGGKKNMDLLSEIIVLRKRTAEILGYQDYVEYQLETRMAKKGENVRSFLEDLRNRLQPAVEKELSNLTRLKREDTRDTNAKLLYYDIPFYIHEHKKKTLSLDEERIREYFPFEHLKQSVFQIFTRLFSIEFKKTDTIPTWHETVEVYEILDQQKQTLAYFFLDTYPRDGKFHHAAAFPLVSGRFSSYEQKQYIAPSVALVTNFPRPSETQPCLLSHEEVLTFLHEFGHVLHGTLTQAPYQSQSGTSVSRDFVEAPSQMLENWFWDREMLQLLSSHYLHPEQKLSSEITNNLLRSKRHMIAYSSARQIVLAQFDLKLHKEEVDNPAQLYSDLVKDCIGIEMPPEHLFPAGFGHLMGYDSGYYGYLWSKVYAADMFTRFQQEGLLNPKTGADYLNAILASGSSTEEAHSLQQFLGRDPNNEAFLREILGSSER